MWSRSRSTIPVARITINWITGGRSLERLCQQTCQLRNPASPPANQFKRSLSRNGRYFATRSMTRTTSGLETMSPRLVTTAGS